MINTDKGLRKWTESSKSLVKREYEKTEEKEIGYQRILRTCPTAHRHFLICGLKKNPSTHQASLNNNKDAAQRVVICVD